MKIQVNRLHHPVTALGPGTRAGIWVQGCSIGCRGCISRDTWEPHEDAATEVDDVLGWLRALPVDRVEGVTISGGEPFDQPDALRELTAGLAAWREERRGTVDVFCYSGYSLARLRRRHPEILAALDAAMTGPYRADLPTDLIWRGSANQELVPLSPLGERRYRDQVENRPQRPPLQAVVELDAIRLIGVPRGGDIGDLTEKLAAAGVDLGTSSWQS